MLCFIVQICLKNDEKKEKKRKKREKKQERHKLHDKELEKETSGFQWWAFNVFILKLDLNALLVSWALTSLTFWFLPWIPASLQPWWSPLDLGVTSDKSDGD